MLWLLNWYIAPAQLYIIPLVALVSLLPELSYKFSVSLIVTHEGQQNI